METLPVHYKRHIFVCVNSRDSGECCKQKDSEQILLKLREHVNSKGLFHAYNVSKSLCLGHCSNGPTIAIYPEGRILRKVSLKDVDEIIKEYLS